MPGQMEAMFDEIGRRWGRLDIAVHSIAFAPKQDLQGGLLNCSAEGFSMAMDISCHSFVRMARLAAPLMTDGGTLFAMTYYGANRVVANYNVMGPVKAALEAACRYLAYELGPRGIRVHPISPGPLTHPRLGRHQGFRVSAGGSRAESAGGRTGGHHGCRRRLHLSGLAIRAPHYRRARSMWTEARTLSPDITPCALRGGAERRLLQHQVRDPCREPGGPAAARWPDRGHRHRPPAAVERRWWSVAEGTDLGSSRIRPCGGNARHRNSGTGKFWEDVGLPPWATVWRMGAPAFGRLFGWMPRCWSILRNSFPWRHCISRTIWSPSKPSLELRADLPQVACFDTEFHCGQAAVARTYALPRELTAEGVLRYGFHGLSYEYRQRTPARLAPKLAAGRVVIAHLGNGASLCAVHNGHSVATTMGFTGVEGLVMGTRCGTIDPGVLLYLMDRPRHGRPRD